MIKAIFSVQESRSKMAQMSILCADDASEWGRFLAIEIQELGKVVQYIVDEVYSLPYNEMNKDVTCIILSPKMLKSNKEFIQKSRIFFANPIIVLCGVTKEGMNQSSSCRAWKRCQTVTVTSSDESTTDFYKSVKARLCVATTAEAPVTEKINPFSITLIPETIVQKANQSCVLMLPRPVGDEVEVRIKACGKSLIAKQKDIHTYVFNVPVLPEGDHELDIYVHNKLVPTKLSLTVICSKPAKCPCDYLCGIIDAKDLNQLDMSLTSIMENDYSNRLFYQNISEPNPEYPEFPTVLHFAAKHGMHSVLRHLLLNVPAAKNALAIKNNKNMDCIDIANNSVHSAKLATFLEEEYPEGHYIDMTRNGYYMKMTGYRRPCTNLYLSDHEMEHARLKR